jgi:DNA-binding GntR family transcriptional regulator
VKELEFIEGILAGDEHRVEVAISEHLRESYQRSMKARSSENGQAELGLADVCQG